MDPKQHTSKGGTNHDLPIAVGVSLIFVTAFLSAILVFLLVVPAVTDERAQLGIFAAQRLADALADPLSRNDRASLTAVLQDAARRDSLTGAAVYGPDNSLLAHLGRLDESDESFSAEISDQETVIGHVSLAFPPSVATLRIYQFTFALLLVNSLAALLLYVSRSLLTRHFDRWSINSRNTRTLEDRGVIAVMKHRLRAINMAPATVRRAVAIYDGTLVAINRDEILVRFPEDEPAQVLKAVCCCTLLIYMQRFSSSTGELRGAICRASPGTGRWREAHHLANLCTPNSLLVSSAVARLLEPLKQVRVTRRSHPLGPEQGLLEITAITSARQHMVEKQARQLLRED